MAEQDPVEVSAAPMTLEEVVAVAGGAGVELRAGALERISAARRTVDDAIARGEAIYGVTTGIGHARDERLPPDALRELQPALVEMHVGAQGPALPTQRVRATILARLNGLARGGSGASPAVARALAALLNHGIHPVIPSRGSVGSGDLGQLALLARVLLGRGEVEVGGRRIAAAQALADAGLEPVTLEPKDALAIMSSNAVSVGHGVLLHRRLAELLELADLVVAASMEAVGANPSVVDAAVAGARSSPGQQAASAGIREALAGSEHVGEPAGASVQDPLSLRVAPQVHGACRDVLEDLADALLAELNAAADNPLVEAASGRVISNGNFHAMNLALTAESLRLALAHVGLLAERRMGHLWDAAVTAMGMAGPGFGEPGGVRSGPPAAAAGVSLRYPAAARYTRLRQLANPVSLDVPVLDLSVEDHATNAAEALVATEEAAEIVRELLAVEVLLASLLLEWDGGAGRLGAGTGRLLAVVGDELEGLGTEAMPDEVHRRVTTALGRHVGDHSSTSRPR